MCSVAEVLRAVRMRYRTSGLTQGHTCSFLIIEPTHQNVSPQASHFIGRKSEEENQHPLNISIILLINHLTKLAAEFLRTMLSQMREFHFEALIKFVYFFRTTGWRRFNTHVHALNDGSLCCFLNINTGDCGQMLRKYARCFQIS